MAQNFPVHRTILDSAQCHSANLYQCHHVSKITHTFYSTEQPNKTVTNITTRDTQAKTVIVPQVQKFQN